MVMSIKEKVRERTLCIPSLTLPPLPGSEVPEIVARAQVFVTAVLVGAQH